MNIRRAGSALLLLLLLAACSRPAPQQNEPPVPAPKQETPSPQQPASEAAALFPVTDTEIRFRLYEKQQPEAMVDEVWLREGGRMVGVIGGKAYVSWEIDMDGVWRKDPKGNDLLRYLPPKLEDGLIWKQVSGGAEILFWLERRDDGCDKPCWTLRVINRGELTIFAFGTGRGPYQAQSEHYTQPDQSFVKRADGQEGTPVKLTPEQRTAWLKTAPASTGSRAVVIPAGPSDWDAAVGKLSGITTVTADLDGDGKPEQMRGQWETWSATAMEIRRGDTGAVVTHAAPWGGQHRLWPVTIGKRTYIASLARTDRGPYFSLLYLANGLVQGVYGWAPKTTGATATSAKVTPDGLITLEWEMGDPAGHIRTRQYRLAQEPLQAKLEAESFRPAGKELKYPANPEELVRAAWTTRWYGGLDAELERYFETPQAAAAFRAADKTGKPYYDNGKVSMATAVIEGKTPQCNLRKQVAPPKDGVVSFVAEWGGYEEWTGAAGQALVTQKDGRWVIREIKIEQHCYMGM